MNVPLAVSATQAGFVVVAALLCMFGFRAGIVRSGSARWTRREDINLRLVWAGLTVWAVGIVFSLVAATIWFSLFGIISWSFTGALTAFMFWVIAKLQRQIKTGAINDYADELADDDEDDD